ncbi:MAG: hypothetical protein E7B34_13105 [Hafnia alvei]|nr:hypothetical protein [Hafnia alvei]
MTSREQFEAKIRLHADENEIEERLATANGGLNYAHPETDVAWIWWQASREAVEIELPQRQSLCASGYGDGYFVPCNSGEGLEYDEVIESIRAVGIKVIKGEKKNG